MRHMRPSPQLAVPTVDVHESPRRAAPLETHAKFGTASVGQQVCPAAHCHGFTLHCDGVAGVLELLQ